MPTKESRPGSVERAHGPAADLLGRRAGVRLSIPAETQ